MKVFQKISLFVFIFISGFGFCQDMKEGFSNLEKGEFDKGEMFFESILKTYPTNKTARLCYARAVGLNKDPKKAFDLFMLLKNDYPDDLEIKLNYAESLLWNKDYKNAKVYYTKLVGDYPTNFVAHLGFANTLSNLKEYKDALYNVNKALDLSPKNGGAMVSRKYIKLGFASENVALKNYDQADKYYDEILADFVNDKETLLNKANLYLMTKNAVGGRATYKLLSPTDPILALNGLSLVEHIAGKESKALDIATQALKQSEVIKDVELIKQTNERYVQALIWNKKFTPAANKIEALEKSYKNENWLLSLSATLAIYKSNFGESIDYYKKILGNDLKSFDGNLGLANALNAAGETEKAIKAVFTTLYVFKNQNDATNFLNKLKIEHTPVLDEKLSYAFDNGNNTSMASKTIITFPVSTKWSFNTMYQFRKTENKITNVLANTNDFMMGASYKFLPKASFNFEAGLTSAKSGLSDYSSSLINAFFKLKPMKLQELEIGYKRDLQNFNTDLIDKQIATNNYYFNYNLGTNFNLGWFTQYFYTTQTDNNTRNLLFTSLYYTLLSKPVVKCGLNYQFLSFKNQVPSVYFSPSKFNAYEIFIEMLRDEKIAERNTVFYNISAATGLQYIEDKEQQSTYRLQGKLGFKFSNRFLINVYGLKSNIASASVAGFVYTEVGFRLNWTFLSKPVFNFNKLK
jgi:tetratricopeptide (TPR) repeat protein